MNQGPHLRRCRVGSRSDLLRQVGYELITVFQAEAVVGIDFLDQFEREFTNRRASPLRDLLELLNRKDTLPVDDGALSAVAYRPVRQDDQSQIELRIRPVAVGQVLPTLPLALDAGQVLAVDFEAAYEEARQRSRM